MYVAAPNGTIATAIARRRGRAGGDAPMMEAFDAWEMRWIARHLPTLDAAWLPASSLDPPFRVVYEHDVYVLTRSDRINLKVRHRENSLKLKTLVERTDDGFERWRTEFDAPLPAGPERFRDVLDLIEREGSPERLGAAARAGEVVEILEANCDPSQLVAVHKSRNLFQRGTCCVDEVRSGPGGHLPFPGGREQQPRRPSLARAGPGTAQPGLAVQLHTVPRAPSLIRRPAGAPLGRSPHSGIVRAAAGDQPAGCDDRSG